MSYIGRTAAKMPPSSGNPPITEFGNILMLGVRADVLRISSNFKLNRSKQNPEHLIMHV